MEKKTKLVNGNAKQNIVQQWIEGVGVELLSKLPKKQLGVVLAGFLLTGCSEFDDKTLSDPLKQPETHGQVHALIQNFKDSLVSHGDHKQRAQTMARNMGGDGIFVDMGATGGITKQLIVDDLVAYIRNDEAFRGLDFNVSFPMSMDSNFNVKFSDVEVWDRMNGSSDRRTPVNKVDIPSGMVDDAAILRHWEKVEAYGPQRTFIRFDQMSPEMRRAVDEWIASGQIYADGGIMTDEGVSFEMYDERMFRKDVTLVRLPEAAAVRRPRSEDGLNL